MKKLMLLCILSLAVINISKAQGDVYYTRNATLKINGEFNNQQLFGKTEELGVRLDYETTEMIIKFRLNTLEFNIDTINTILKFENQEITFTGELSLEYINTKGHPPLDFLVEGWLTTGSSKTKIKGKGELVHMNDSGSYVCMLGMSLTLNLNELNIDIPSGLYEEVEVIVTQALLERDKN